MPNAIFYKKWSLDNIAAIRHELDSIEAAIRANQPTNTAELLFQVMRLEIQCRNLREELNHD
jgi:hypothetical protein